MLHLSLFIFLLFQFSCVSTEPNTKIFIMASDKMPLMFKTKEAWHASCLGRVSSSDVLYSYSHAVEGFAAQVTTTEAERLLLQPGVVSMLPEIRYKPLTTRTPTFLGLEAKTDPFPNGGSDVIVGVIDTGVWPESPSFNDIGYSRVPRTWRGECEEGANFTSSLCNRKLVGARFFLKGFEAEMGPVTNTVDFKSPRDSHGHGTHTASIAVGSVVKGATFLGYATGEARGMAPRARLAVYKACWSKGYCMSSHILAAKIGMLETIQDSAVSSMSAAGVIYALGAYNGREIIASYGLLPSVTVDKKSGDVIRNYILSSSNPTATVRFKGTVVDVKPSPVVGGFSSRGPNPVTPGILKPDVIAPGVNILAAWTRFDFDFGFNIESGTSMACPHVSGLAALLKAAHPEWSPAAIRSALMTTASRTGNDGMPILDSATRQPSTPFVHGAGHVSPVSALNPGLIYDVNGEDYLDFLCAATNYTSSQIRTVARRDFTCDPKKEYRVADLNYPSFALRIDQSGGAYRFTRVVTSVGGAGTYSVQVFFDQNVVNVSVQPPVISFKQVNEKISYTVTFLVNPSLPTGTNRFGSIEWSDGRHVVKSPVALSWR